MWTRTYRSLRSARSLPALILGSATLLCQAPSAGSPASQEAEYPGAVLRLTGNRRPFTPGRVDIPYEFPLKRLVTAQRGTHYGSAIKLTIDPLGEKLLLIDTAARGLLLKSPDLSGKDIVSVPEWILPGPGLQTGIFRVLGRVSARGFSMEPAVAELFPERGFAWIDGVISTELFKAWLVRLDFRRSRLSLIPYRSSVDSALTECEAQLDRNWWIVMAVVRGKPANLLLDSGTPQTYLGEEWILRNLGPIGKRQHTAGHRDAKFFVAGVWDIGIANITRVKVSCLYTDAGHLPVVTGAAIDGVLGFDAMRELDLELDYTAAKLRVRR